MSQGQYDSTEKETIKDPDGHFQIRRGDSILDNWTRVFEKRREARDYLAQGGSDQFANSLVRQAVEDFIIDSEQVIRGYLPDDDSDAVSPPITRAIEGLQDVAKDVWRENELGEIQTSPRVENYEIKGLKGYLETPDPVRITYTMSESSPVKGTVREQREEVYQIPMSVSMNAFRQVHRFWNEFGMDLSPDDEIDTVANPY